MSSRGLVKSMIVIGGAQAIQIFISIFRMKVVAILLGPSGIGLLSIYSNLQSMVASAAGLGIGSSGVREIAIVNRKVEELSLVRRVLFTAHIVQGALAVLGVWMLRSPIAIWLFGSESYSTEVGLIGISVFLLLIGTSQTALLQGLRRIADLASITVLSALAGTAAGLSAIWVYGEAGLVWFIIATAGKRRYWWRFIM